MAEKTILVVDYDPRAVESMAALFRPRGCRIVTATDGLAAWDKFQLEKPDLVILEAILPKLHGFDLTRRIVQESNGTVPVVIVTGLYRGPQYRHEALTSFGAAAYFEKPLDEERFMQYVLDLLKEKTDIRLGLPTSDEIVEFLKTKLAAGGTPPPPRN